jgi:hypothetical protein
MNADRSILVDLRHTLLRLHKTLLEWERSGYERIHGRMTGHTLLQTILNDPQFAWLRPISELIVYIDAALENERSDLAAERETVVARARALISPDAAGPAHADRYRAALQDSPDAIVAHRDVAHVLKKNRDAVLPSHRPH